MRQGRYDNACIADDSAGELSCGFAAWLPHSSQLEDVSSGANLSALLQDFSPTAISWLGCSQSALLHTVTSFAALPCIMSDQPQSVSSAAMYLL